LKSYDFSFSIDGQEKYRVLRNLIIRKSREAKEKYLEKKCSEIETLMKTGSSYAAYRIVKMFFGQHKPRARGI